MTALPPDEVLVAGPRADDDTLFALLLDVWSPGMLLEESGHGDEFERRIIVNTFNWYVLDGTGDRPAVDGAGVLPGARDVPRHAHRRTGEGRAGHHRPLPAN